MYSADPLTSMSFLCVLVNNRGKHERRANQCQRYPKGGGHGDDDNERSNDGRVEQRIDYKMIAIAVHSCWGPGRGSTHPTKRNEWFSCFSSMTKRAWAVTRDDGGDSSVHSVFRLYDALTDDHRRYLVDPLIDNHIHRLHPLDPAVLQKRLPNLRLTCASYFRLHWTAGVNYAGFLARVRTGHVCNCANHICHLCWLHQRLCSASRIHCAWCSPDTCARELRFFAAARRVDN